jgi:Mu-like prophage I protein
MKIIQAIEKREDVSPSEGKSKYGDVKYADEKNKKYPIDSEAHVRAAWSYINMPKNAGKYSSEDVKTIKGRIKAAGKKYGIDFSDNGDKTESSLVYAAAVDLEGKTPSEIVFMPKTAAEGITITPMVGGKAKTVSLNVDESVAELLQAGLTKRLADEIEPYAGFDHRPGPASFHPKEFKWDEDRGVILEIDWTQAGKDAVSGRNYKYLSPTFMYDGKNVAGLPEIGEVGSLTNNPAIRYKTMKIAASADDDDTGEQSKMVKLTDKLVELEVITAEQAVDADEEFLVRAVTGLHEALATVQAANARLVSENTALAAKAIEVQKAEATTIVQAAIAEGKIPAKDQLTIDFYTAQLIAQPETAKKVLAAMPKNPLLQKVIDVKVSDTKKVAQGQSNADLVQAQHLAIAEVQEAHPNLSYTDAFNKAKREHPEVFLAET